MQIFCKTLEQKLTKEVNILGHFVKLEQKLSLHSYVHFAFSQQQKILNRLIGRTLAPELYELELLDTCATPVTVNGTPCAVSTFSQIGFRVITSRDNLKQSIDGLYSYLFFIKC